LAHERVILWGKFAGKFQGKIPEEHPQKVSSLCQNSSTPTFDEKWADKFNAKAGTRASTS